MADNLNLRKMDSTFYTFFVNGKEFHAYHRDTWSCAFSKKAWHVYRAETIDTEDSIDYIDSFDSLEEIRKTAPGTFRTN